MIADCCQYVRRHLIIDGEKNDEVSFPAHCEEADHPCTVDLGEKCCVYPYDQEDDRSP